MKWVLGTLHTGDIFKPTDYVDHWILGRLTSPIYMRPGDRIKLQYEGFEGETCVPQIEITTFGHPTHVLIFRKQGSVEHQVQFGPEELIEWFIMAQTRFHYLEIESEKFTRPDACVAALTQVLSEQESV